jgi:hypothetical protein
VADDRDPSPGNPLEVLISALKGLRSSNQRTIRTEKSPASIEPGEAWADAALQDLHSMTAEQRAVWTQILGHAFSAN